MYYAFINYPFKNDVFFNWVEEDAQVWYLNELCQACYNDPSLFDPMAIWLPWKGGESNRFLKVALAESIERCIGDGFLALIATL